MFTEIGPYPVPLLCLLHHRLQLVTLLRPYPRTARSSHHLHTALTQPKNLSYSLLFAVHARKLPLYRSGLPKNLVLAPPLSWNGVSTRGEKVRGLELLRCPMLLRRKVVHSQCSGNEVEVTAASARALRQQWFAALGRQLHLYFRPRRLAPRIELRRSQDYHAQPRRDCRSQH